MAELAGSLDSRIRNAKVEPGEREAVIDCGGGLRLRVLPRGRKSDKSARIFTFRYRPKGSSAQRRVVIGHYPDMTVARARIEAERMRSEVRNGGDPAEEIKRRRHAADAPGTVNDLVARFLSGHARLKNKASTAAETERLLKKHIQGKLGNRRLGDVRKSDIAALLEQELKRILEERKGVRGIRGTAANRIRAAVSKLFAFAVSSGWLEINPAQGIAAVVNERPRERTLTDQEIGQLWNALLPLIDAKAPASMTHRIVALLLLTGARASEIATLRQRHFERDASTLVFEDAKNKSSNRTLPLSGSARAMLLPASGVQTDKPESFLFPLSAKLGLKVRRAAPDRHIPRESITRAGARLGRKLGHSTPEPWTIHDLRRSFITWAHELGYEPELVRRITGHAARDVHGRVYDRSKRLEAMRQLLNDWAAHVADCAAKEAGQGASNVVRLAG